MKKLLIGILLSLLAIFLIAALAVFLFIRSITPEAEENLAYGKDEQLQLINQQLTGLDLEAIRAKKDLIMEKSIAEIQNSIRDKKLNYTELNAFYLDRIANFDAQTGGLNAVSAINPQTIAQAKKLDEMLLATPLSANPDRSAATELMGIPVIVKDNINTKNMVTSVGTYALKDFKPATEAKVITQLEKAGAIIIGKANLSELANFMSPKMPSGYSSSTGQTHNPFLPLKISPLGSSAGSAVAVAANLATVSIGTETTGSIMAPAAINSVVGFKPSREAISSEGVAPLSSTIDTVGTMGKTVADSAKTYWAAIGQNHRSQEITWDNGNLKNKTIGIVEHENSKLLADALEKAGAKTKIITLSEDGIDNSYIINQDFRSDLNRYLQKYDAPVKTLKELIEFNNKDEERRAKYGQGLIEGAQDSAQEHRSKVEEMVKTAQTRLDNAFKQEKLDAIVFFDNDGVILPAVAGYPELTVPIGKFEGEEQPRGATFIMKAGQDEELIQIAHSFEHNTKARLIPSKYLEKTR